ncbi:L,D-transpeptidase family protein [Legionella nagasakiensis]|uniref:L,D-transpeptidase family protein n=1 Tax=Legionella nagasakiensis TaxID=535290 RepID=UPI00105490F5|nr:L,D-transpeptidase family protein [Legionella nagasakiensis]
MIHKLLKSFLFLLYANHLTAAIYALPAEGDVVGQLFFAHPHPGETLSEVGIRFDIGFEEMRRANPHADEEQPLSPQITLLIPSQFVLPAVPRRGIVINLPEYRLYYFPEHDNVVITQPVGIGRQGWNTPIGVTHIIAKQKDPIWRPTVNLKAYATKQGQLLPEEFPPGPANPLGRYVLRLGWSTYLIHGSNHADGVGMRASAGCIRMLPDDIEYLYELVNVGTQVKIINEPLKFGQLDDIVYMEAHPMLQEKRGTHIQTLVEPLLKHLGATASLINQKAMQQELNLLSGVPRKISI